MSPKQWKRLSKERGEKKTRGVAAGERGGKKGDKILLKGDVAGGKGAPVK